MPGTEALPRKGAPVAGRHALGRQQIHFRGERKIVEVLTADSLDGLDLVLSSASSAVALTFAPIAVRAGAVVIDNSSAFRMNADVPLVIPEVNGQAAHGHHGIIANPNCSTIISVTPLWPLHRRFQMRRMVVSTYQAASGAGAAAMKELLASTAAHLAGEPYDHRVLPHPYAFNLFSHNSSVDPKTGYNSEELKIISETRKIFGAPELLISATCVRVPVLRAHAVSLSVEFEHSFRLPEVKHILAGSPGVRIVDDWENNIFPMPRDASETDEILVGRIRQDISDPSGRTLCLFLAGDQLLKGAALNAVQIAELLLRGE